MVRRMQCDQVEDCRALRGNLEVRVWAPGGFCLRSGWGFVELARKCERRHVPRTHHQSIIFFVMTDHSSALATAREILDTMLGTLGFFVTIHEENDERGPGLQIESEDAAILIGNKGDRL